MSNNGFSLRCPFQSFLLGVITTTAVLAGVQAHALYQEYVNIKKSKDEIPEELLGSGYDKELESAVSVALECGLQITKVIDDLGKKKIDKAERKGDSSADWVTETDKENEEIIFRALMKRFPKHQFIGEESSSESKEGIPPLTNAPTWIVDPVDGTTNFVHSFPFTCVSIGLCVNKRPILGVVYCGSTNELFLTVRGRGAFLNRNRIRTSQATKLTDSLIITDFGYGREPKDLDSILRVMGRLLINGAQGVRQMGSGVLSLCYVACGRLDACYAGVANEGWKPWDFCAGSLLVEEAGGVMSDLSGEEFDVYGKEVLACCSGPLRDTLVSAIKTFSAPIDENDTELNKSSVSIGLSDIYPQNEDIVL